MFQNSLVLPTALLILDESGERNLLRSVSTTDILDLKLLLDKLVLSIVLSFRLELDLAGTKKKTLFMFTQMPPGRWVCCSLLWPLTWQVLRKEPPGEMTMMMMMTMLTGSWILTYCKVTRISSVSILQPIDYVQRCFQLYVIALYHIFFWQWIFSMLSGDVSGADFWPMDAVGQLGGRNVCLSPSWSDCVETSYYSHSPDHLPPIRKRQCMPTASR